MEEHVFMGDMTKETSSLCLKEAYLIYENLIDKYPPTSEKNLDIIMNSLAAAIICLLKTHVKEGGQVLMAQLIHRIINKNL